MHEAWKRGAWLLGALALLGARPSPARSGPAAKVQREEVNWRIGAMQVVSPGETATLPPDREAGFPGGTLTKDRVLEGRVRAKRGALVPDGVIRITLSAFSPAADMPGQKAGVWYVEGKWVMVDAKADRKALEVRHNPHVLEGRIQAALPFDPTAHDAPWAARATLPAAHAGGRWARGVEGSLTFDPRQGADLFIVLQGLAGAR